MAWGHSVATVVIDATDQQGFGFGACDRVIVALVVELGLHRVKEITIEDGGLLTGEDLALEGDLADVEPIAQKMGEWAAGEWDAANRAPGLERSHLGDDFPLAEVGHQQVEAAKLQIPPKDGPNALSLLFNHDDLAILGRISERGYAPDPQPLALGGRDLVADPLADDLDRRGIRSKPRKLSDGRTIGGGSFGVGALAYLLKNRFYIGEVVYRGEVHHGDHVPILDPTLFAAVQAKLRIRGP